jgi:multiple sugar transport system ATP-binding protein
MADIIFDDVWKVFADGTEAIRELSLSIADKEFMVLVGPSGCGKTTALRMVAGLESVSRGEVLIGDRVVNDVPPKERDIAMVFQNYALYPHMSVFDNMAFGLKLQKVPRHDIELRVGEAARILGLDELLKRKPAALSGGQRQRVAMGRAIVRHPQAFLMDEPLSNLDAKLRVQMRTEVSRLQNELGTTTVYVTHDQTEAMTLGDRVAVMRKGLLQQVGSPQELYDEPRNLFVAGFIGSPSMNFLPVTVEGGRAKLPFCEVEVSDDARKALEGTQGTLLAGIRPEHFEDSAFAGDKEGPRFEVEIDLLESMGSELYVYFDAHSEDASLSESEELRELAEDAGGTDLPSGSSTQVTARLDAASKAARGERIELWLDPSKLHFFDASSGERLAGP